jgi:hypothetical protein
MGVIYCFLVSVMSDEILTFKVKQLHTIRTVLLVLHKTLMDSQKLLYEARYGPIGGPNEYFKIVLEDEEFVWLRTFSLLIVEIDEAIYSKRNPVTLEAATALLDVARQTLQPSPVGSVTAQNYYLAIERDTTIAKLHLQIKQVFDP